MGALAKIFLNTVMTKEPLCIDIDEPFSRVWDMFQGNNIRHLPVVDEQGILKGIITQRDLYRVESPRVTLEGELVYDKMSLDRHILKYVMTKKVFTLSPDDTLRFAIQAMIHEKYGCIPIVDEHKCLVGIVTPVNILKAIAEYFI
jgi:CBS domain-containing protein